jgi:hypothetical protein
VCRRPSSLLRYRKPAKAASHTTDGLCLQPCWTHDLNIAVNWKAGAVNCKVHVWSSCTVMMLSFDGAEISGNPLVLA